MVSSPEHGSRSETVQVSAGETARVEVVLQPACSISGRTVALDGTTLAGVLVLAPLEPREKPIALDSPYIEKDWAEMLRYDAAEYAATRSRADGSWRLGGLPAGLVFVLGQNAEAGWAVENLELEPGSAVERLELVLERGLELRCRLEDEQGGPLPGLLVFVARTADAAEGTTYGSRGPFRTDELGRIAVPNCADAAYVLDVRVRHDENRSLASSAAHDLRPGATEHRVLVRYEDPPVAVLTGTVLDDGGRPLLGARIDLKFANDSSRRIASTGADGVFRTEIEPVTCRLELRARGFPYVMLPERAFAAGETTDIGTVRLPTPGFLRGRISREDGGPLDGDHVGVKLEPSDGSFWWSRIEVEAGEALFDPIAPGDYTVEASAAGCATLRVPVRIEAGREHEIELHLRAAPEGR